MGCGSSHNEHQNEKIAKPGNNNTGNERINKKDLKTGGSSKTKKSNSGVYKLSGSYGSYLSIGVGADGCKALVGTFEEMSAEHKAEDGSISMPSRFFKDDKTPKAVLINTTSDYTMNNLKSSKLSEFQNVPNNFSVYDNALLFNFFDSTNVIKEVGETIRKAAEGIDSLNGVIYYINGCSPQNELVFNSISDFCCNGVFMNVFVNDLNPGDYGAINLTKTMGSIIENVDIAHIANSEKYRSGEGKFHRGLSSLYSGMRFGEGSTYGTNFLSQSNNPFCRIKFVSMSHIEESSLSNVSSSISKLFDVNNNFRKGILNQKNFMTGTVIFRGNWPEITTQNYLYKMNDKLQGTNVFYNTSSMEMFSTQFVSKTNLASKFSATALFNHQSNFINVSSNDWLGLVETLYDDQAVIGLLGNSMEAVKENSSNCSDLISEYDQYSTWQNSE